MEKPISSKNNRLLRHALSALTIISAMVALPASAQNVEPVLAEVADSQLPVPPSWSFLEDADQDGMMDIDEILWGMDPLNPEDGLSDLDGDEIFLAWEFDIGTNPNEADTDTDDWSDSEEYLLYGTDPLDPFSFPLGGAPDGGGDTEPTSPPSFIPVPEAVLPPPPPPPSLSNGDFSDVSITAWNSMLASKEYQGGGFMWGAGAIGGWTAYAGTTVEVWDAGGEKFVELDGSPGNYGIKQQIANAKAGGYILTWWQSGRNSSKAGTDPYCVRVYYMNGTTEVQIGQSPEFTNFSKMSWADNAFGFQITPAQLAAAGTNPIYVAFIPTGASLNTYGTLIDKVRLIPVEFDMAIASYGDLADLPDYDDLTKSPVSPPHEMDPGSLVITPTKNELLPRKRSRLTLSMIGNPVYYGNFSLTMQGLDPKKVGIYETPDGGKPITLPKIWQASDFPASVTYYVGALPFEEEAELQDGTLEFGYTPTSNTELIQPVEKETVRVQVIPTSANLTISSIKDVEALPEDQGADGQGLMPPHEMEPGSLVVAPVDWRVTPTTRSKLVLQAKGAISADAQFTLTSNNLSRVAIYNEQTGGTPLKDQELRWTASQLNAGVTVHVGALSFAADDAAQDGTLTLTGKIIPPGASESEAVQVKDTVRVRLEPLAVDLKIVRFYNDPDDLAENDLAETSSVSTPHEMDPGSLVFAPVDGYPHPPGYRSRLTLTRSEYASAIGTITLSAEGLNNVAIYDDEQRFEDFRKVNLPKQWKAADFVNGLVLHVGSNPFATNAAAQDGTLTLTHRVSAAEGLPYVEIKDAVRVTLNPLAVDLAIASMGNENYLAEDRQINGLTAPTPHEMNPGSMVIAPVQGNASPGTRSQLKLSAKGQGSTSGTYTLTSQNLSKVEIYSSPTGGSPLLPADLQWAAEDLADDKLLYVGSQAFGPTEQAQEGTLTFTFTPTLKTGSQSTAAIGDKVRVHLMPAAVDLAISSIGNADYLANDLQPGGDVQPPPNELDPGSMVIAPVQGNSSPGTRSRLKLSAMGQGSTSGTYILTTQNLSKVEIYNSPTGGTPLLPADLQWDAEEFVNDKLLYVGSQAFASPDLAQDGTLTFTFTPNFTTGSQSSVSFHDQVRVRLLPVEVVVHKKNGAPPTDGMLAKVGDTLVYEITDDPASFPLPASAVTWEWRKLKGDGTLGPWTTFSSGFGPRVDALESEAGIFQIRVKIVAGGSTQHFGYRRKVDDPYGSDSHGTMNPIYKAGLPDCVGIAAGDSQLKIAQEARSVNGSTAWALSAIMPITPAITAPSGANKCNVFIYHMATRAGSTVPLDSGGWPPRAYDWYDSGKAITGWTWRSDSVWAEPGTMVSRYIDGDSIENLFDWGFRWPSSSAHCGIIDYDGAWINAGSKNVNRYPHLTSSGYQTAYTRKN